MLKKRELINLGIISQEALALATHALTAARALGYTKDRARSALCNLVSLPQSYTEDPLFGELARHLTAQRHGVATSSLPPPVPYASWGNDIDRGAHEQMENACCLPVSVAGALMPDAHVGYGLPIGGVLATKNAVIPYAVGVDIGCRVKLSVIDVPLHYMERHRQRFQEILQANTSFGVGARWDRPRYHEVLDDPDWGKTPLLRSLKPLATEQLGTSGSGNHFVEFGKLTLFESVLDLPPGDYTAVVSHSGSRGPGSKVALNYSNMARNAHPELPRNLAHLAWLDLDSSAGQEYWQAMNLMGRYASANHAVIHRQILNAIGATPLLVVENHHNFAWEEEHGGSKVIVHRKGATPAGQGVLGYIPGTMIHPGYLVRGKGLDASLDSCSHGAGRRMSRKEAKQTTTKHALKQATKDANVTLLSAGLDESPHAYKNIDEVMQAQVDLTTPLGSFQPFIVKMAPEGERPED